MKKQLMFKLKMNFRIANANPEIQKHNFALYRTSLLTIITFLLIFSPFFAYLYILYNNPNLDAYFQHYAQIANHLNLPSRASFFATAWIGFGIALVAILLIAFFKPLVTMDGMNNHRQLLVVGITFALTMALLLTAISQYFYSQFESFFDYQSVTKNIDQKQDWVQDISKIFSKNKESFIGDFSWQTTAVVWWVLFFQISVVFALTVFLQNTIFAKNDTSNIEQYIDYSTTSNLTSSRLIRKVASFFKANDKTFSAWLLILAFIIVLPNFAFCILLSVNGTKINAVINWTHNVPNLLQDYKGVSESGGGSLNDLFAEIFKNNNLTSNYFLLNSLPIIVIGLTFATTFFFFSVIIRGEKTSAKIFIVQYIAMSLEILFLFSYLLYVKVEVNQLADAWSTSAGVNYIEKLKTLIGDDFEAIVGLHATAQIIGTKTGQLEWWTQSGVFAEAITGFSVIFALLFGIWIGIAKNKKKSSRNLKNVN